MSSLLLALAGPWSALCDGHGQTREHAAVPGECPLDTQTAIADGEAARLGLVLHATRCQHRDSPLQPPVHLDAPQHDHAVGDVGAAVAGEPYHAELLRDVQG